MCTLNLSKVLMYEFHYHYSKIKHSNNSILFFADPYSLICEIKTKDVYEDFSKDKGMFELSNSTKSKYHDDSNKLVVG